MIVQTLVSGYAFPQGAFQAWVHSVFHSALNLRLLDGRLVTLVTNSGDDLPQGARLRQEIAFDETGLSAGDAATCAGDLLRFTGRGLSVDLRAARRWDSCLADLPGDPDSPHTGKALEELYEQLIRQQAYRQQAGQPGGLDARVIFRAQPPAEPGLTRHAWEPVWNLIAAARQYSPPPVSALARLVGLGPGLTPSGDDFLVGFLAGLWSCAGARPERTTYAAWLGERVGAEADIRTNEISCAYLLHAGQGRVARRLYELARVLCAGAPAEQREQAARAAMASGHSSGMDTLCGLLAGFAAWNASAVSFLPAQPAPNLC